MALLTTEQRLLAPVLGGRQTVWTGRPLRGFRLRKGDAGQLAPLLVALPFLDLDMKPDGAGSISFGEVQTPPWWMSNRTWFVPRAPSFDCIANVSDVYDLCTKLQQGKST